MFESDIDTDIPQINLYYFLPSIGLCKLLNISGISFLIVVIALNHSHEQKKYKELHNACFLYIIVNIIIIILTLCNSSYIFNLAILIITQYK